MPAYNPGVRFSPEMLMYGARDLGAGVERGAGAVGDAIEKERERLRMKQDELDVLHGEMSQMAEHIPAEALDEIRRMPLSAQKGALTSMKAQALREQAYGDFQQRENFKARLEANGEANPTSYTVSLPDGAQAVFSRHGTGLGMYKDGARVQDPAEMVPVMTRDAAIAAGMVPKGTNVLPEVAPVSAYSGPKYDIGQVIDLPGVGKAVVERLMKDGSPVLKTVPEDVPDAERLLQVQDVKMQAQKAGELAELQARMRNGEVQTGPEWLPSWLPGVKRLDEKAARLRGELGVKEAGGGSKPSAAGVSGEDQAALQWLNDPKNANSPYRAGVESKLKAKGLR